MLIREESLFRELDRRLSQEGIQLEIICVGGFVLGQYGIRTTHDIDGFFGASDVVNRLIREVGDQFHVNSDEELWLNNAVQNLNSPPSRHICKLLYDLPNLKVWIAPLDYIAGMKLISAREQDIKDVASIIQALHMEAPSDLHSIIAKYGFPAVDESIVLEAFGEAYGMDWLEKYYMDHEEDFF